MEIKISVFSLNTGNYRPEKASTWTSFGLNMLSPNTEKYGPEKPPHLDTFHTVVKKSSKVGQDQKDFDICFSVIFDFITKF